MSFLRENEDITDRLDSMLYAYDPRRGLVILRGTLGFHSGMLTCRATLGDVTSEFAAILQFQQIEVVPPPYIEEPK